MRTNRLDFKGGAAGDATAKVDNDMAKRTARHDWVVDSASGQDSVHRLGRSNGHPHAHENQQQNKQRSGDDSSNHLEHNLEHNLEDN